HPLSTLFPYTTLFRSIHIISAVKLFGFTNFFRNNGNGSSGLTLNCLTQTALVYAGSPSFQTVLTSCPRLLVPFSIISFNTSSYCSLNPISLSPLFICLPKELIYPHILLIHLLNKLYNQPNLSGH